MSKEKDTPSASEMKPGSPLGVRPDAIGVDGSFTPHKEGVVQDGSHLESDEAKSSKKKDK